MVSLRGFWGVLGGFLKGFGWFFRRFSGVFGGFWVVFRGFRRIFVFYLFFRWFLDGFKKFLRVISRSFERV